MIYIKREGEPHDSNKREIIIARVEDFLSCWEEQTKDYQVIYGYLYENSLGWRSG